MNYFKTTSERLAEAMRLALLFNTKLRDPVPMCPPRELPPHFTIALSREAGVDATAVARAVGQRLGWPVYDQELVEIIARKMGVRAELLKDVDERELSWWQETLESFVSGVSVSEAAYVHWLADTLFELAKPGERIVVGRGAAQVLPPQRTLRVRLIGPLKERIAAAQQERGLSADEAARWVKQADQQRTAFVKEHFQKDPADPDQYDLLLNAFRFSAAECAELIVTALNLLSHQESGTHFAQQNPA